MPLFRHHAFFVAAHSTGSVSGASPTPTPVRPAQPTAAPTAAPASFQQLDAASAQAGVTEEQYVQDQLQRLSPAERTPNAEALLKRDFRLAAGQDHSLNQAEFLNLTSTPAASTMANAALPELTGTVQEQQTQLNQWLNGPGRAWAEQNANATPPVVARGADGQFSLRGRHGGVDGQAGPSTQAVTAAYNQARTEAAQAQAAQQQAAATPADAPRTGPDATAVAAMSNDELMALSNDPAQMATMPQDGLRKLVERCKSWRNNEAWNDASGRVLASIIHTDPGMLDRQMLVDSGNVGNYQLASMVQAIRGQGQNPQEVLARLSPTTLQAMRDQMENGGGGSDNAETLSFIRGAQNSANERRAPEATA